MVSMVTLGVSFLLFFVVAGLMWSISIFILDKLFDAVPMASGGWLATDTESRENVKTIMIWVPAILTLFASIKMLSAAAVGRGYVETSRY